eukprot:CFRG0052T1
MEEQERMSDIPGESDTGDQQENVSTGVSHTQPHCTVSPGTTAPAFAHEPNSEHALGTVTPVENSAVPDTSSASSSDTDGTTNNEGTTGNEDGTASSSETEADFLNDHVAALYPLMSLCLEPGATPSVILANLSAIADVMERENDRFLTECEAAEDDKAQDLVGEMILEVWNATNGFYDRLCTDYFHHYNLSIVIQATRILAIMCTVVEPEFLQTREDIILLVDRARQSPNMVLRTYATGLLAVALPGKIIGDVAVTSRTLSVTMMLRLRFYAKYFCGIGLTPIRMNSLPQSSPAHQADGVDGGRDSRNHSHTHAHTHQDATGEDFSFGVGGMTLSEEGVGEYTEDMYQLKMLNLWTRTPYEHIPANHVTGEESDSSTPTEASTADTNAVLQRNAVEASTSTSTLVPTRTPTHTLEEPKASSAAFKEFEIYLKQSIAFQASTANAMATPISTPTKLAHTFIAPPTLVTTYPTSTITPIKPAFTKSGGVLPAPVVSVTVKPLPWHGVWGSEVCGPLKRFRVMARDLAFVIEVLTQLGEYTEMVSVLFQFGCLELVAKFLEIESFSRSTFNPHSTTGYAPPTTINSYNERKAWRERTPWGCKGFGFGRIIVHHTVRLTCTMLLFHKFGSDFVSSRGLLGLLGVRDEFNGNDIAMCLWHLSAVSSVMEKLCLLPHDVVRRVMVTAYDILSSHSTLARRHSALFLAMAFTYPALVDVADSMNGLQQLMGALDRLMPDMFFFAAGERQLTMNVLLALRQYFRLHLHKLGSNIRRVRSRMDPEVTPPPPMPAYAPAVLDSDTLTRDLNIVRTHPNLATGFKASTTANTNTNSSVSSTVGASNGSLINFSSNTSNLSGGSSNANTNGNRNTNTLANTNTHTQRTATYANETDITLPVQSDAFGLSTSIPDVLYFEPTSRHTNNNTTTRTTAENTLPNTTTHLVPPHTSTPPIAPVGWEPLDVAFRLGLWKRLLAITKQTRFWRGVDCAGVALHTLQVLSVFAQTHNTMAMYTIALNPVAAHIPADAHQGTDTGANVSTGSDVGTGVSVGVSARGDRFDWLFGNSSGRDPTASSSAAESSVNGAPTRGSNTDVMDVDIDASSTSNAEPPQTQTQAESQPQTQTLPTHQPATHELASTTTSTPSNSADPTTQSLSDGVDVTSLLTVGAGAGDSEMTGLGLLFACAEGKYNYSPVARKAALAIICNMVSRGPNGMQNSSKKLSRWNRNSSFPYTLAREEPILGQMQTLVRERNGIKTLRSLLHCRAPLVHADEIRTLACCALLGLSENQEVKQILGKLQISNELSELMHEPVVQDNSATHAEFTFLATEIIARVTGKQARAIQSEAAGHMLSKIEKTAIVENTEVSFSNNELLYLIYDHLVSCGFKDTANQLTREAGLPNLPQLQSLLRGMGVDVGMGGGRSVSLIPNKTIGMNSILTHRQHVQEVDAHQPHHQQHPQSNLNTPRPHDSNSSHASSASVSACSRVAKAVSMLREGIPDNLDMVMGMGIRTTSSDGDFNNLRIGDISAASVPPAGVPSSDFTHVHSQHPHPYPHPHSPNHSCVQSHTKCTCCQDEIGDVDVSARMTSTSHGNEAEKIASVKLPPTSVHNSSSSVSIPNISSSIGDSMPATLVSVSNNDSIRSLRPSTRITRSLRQQAQQQVQLMVQQHKKQTIPLPPFSSSLYPSLVSNPSSSRRRSRMKDKPQQQLTQLHQRSNTRSAPMPQPQSHIRLASHQQPVSQLSRTLSPTSKGRETNADICTNTNTTTNAGTSGCSRREECGTVKREPDMPVCTAGKRSSLRLQRTVSGQSPSPVHHAQKRSKAKASVEAQSETYTNTNTPSSAKSKSKRRFVQSSTCTTKMDEVEEIPTVTPKSKLDTQSGVDTRTGTPLNKSDTTTTTATHISTSTKAKTNIRSNTSRLKLAQPCSSTNLSPPQSVASLLLSSPPAPGEKLTLASPLGTFLGGRKGTPYGPVRGSPPPFQDLPTHEKGTHLSTYSSLSALPQESQQVPPPQKQHVYINAHTSSHSNQTLTQLQPPHSHSHKHQPAIALNHATNIAAPVVSLQDIVGEYLRAQHTTCPNPVSVLPPFPLLTKHQCPEPRLNTNAHPSLFKRLAAREHGVVDGGRHGARMTRKLIYSRFKPIHSFRVENQAMTSVSYLGNTNKLLVGTHRGDMLVFNLDSGELIDTYECHENVLYSIRPSHDTQRVLTSTPSFSSGRTSALWKFASMMYPAVEFPNDRFVTWSNLNDDYIIGTQANTAHIYDGQTGTLISTLVDRNGSNEYERNCACFNPTDDLVLSDGTLWDPRQRRKLHKFDKFNNYAIGNFHPNGLEIIVNSEIWDMRTFKLMRSIPSLDQAQLMFSSKQDVMYGVIRNFDEDRPLRSNSQFGSSFRTYDAASYMPIATVDLERTLIDMSVSYHDEYMAVCESSSVPSGAFNVDGLCRLYAIGRKRGGGVAGGAEGNDQQADFEAERTNTEEEREDLDELDDFDEGWSDDSAPDDWIVDNMLDDENDEVEEALEDSLRNWYY